MITSYDRLYEAIQEKDLLEIAILSSQNDFLDQRVRLIQLITDPHNCDLFPVFHKLLQVSDAEQQEILESAVWSFRVEDQNWIRVFFAAMTSVSFQKSRAHTRRLLDVALCSNNHAFILILLGLGVDPYSVVDDYTALDLAREVDNSAGRLLLGICEQGLHQTSELESRPGHLR